ncbi:MAG: CoA transferase, partial [Sneathiellales bacterium]|nr:CoA transferase [Sneathiellales bacterium]
RGRGREAGSATVHPCKDGYFAIAAIMGKNKIMWDPFVKWMKDENVEEAEVFEDPRWIEPSYRRSKEGYDTFCRIFHRYTMNMDKMTLYEKAQANRIALSPVSNGKDLLENPQLKHRNFWQVVEHENLGGEVTYPGAPYEFGELDWRFGFPAPKFGEHTAPIMKTLDYSDEEIALFAKEGIIHV